MPFENRLGFHAEDGTRDELDSFTLPEMVMNWFGLTDDQCFQIEDMNDDGMTFKEIADAIEGWIPSH